MAASCVTEIPCLACHRCQTRLEVWHRPVMSELFLRDGNDQAMNIVLDAATARQIIAALRPIADGEPSPWNPEGR